MSSSTESLGDWDCRDDTPPCCIESPKDTDPGELAPAVANPGDLAPAVPRLTPIGKLPPAVLIPMEKHERNAGSLWALMRVEV